MTTDPKGASGAAKAQLHLIPLPALEACSGALALGAKKYGERNWANASPGSSTYISAALRHIHAWQSGEDLDPESGLSHLGHAMAGLAIMLDAKALGTLVDERIRREGLQDLKKSLEAIQAARAAKADADWKTSFKGYCKGEVVEVVEGTTLGNAAEQAVKEGFAVRGRTQHDDRFSIAFIKNV